METMRYFRLAFALAIIFAAASAVGQNSFGGKPSDGKSDAKVENEYGDRALTASPALLTFTDQATFLGEVQGANLRFEGFEGLTPRNDFRVEILTLTDFTMRHAGGAASQAQLTTFNVPLDGRKATEGTQYVSWRTGTGVKALIIEFNPPVDAFGFTMTDALDTPASTITLSTDAGDSETVLSGSQANGSINFFGTVFSTTVSTITLLHTDASEGLDTIGFDEFYYRTPTFTATASFGGVVTDALSGDPVGEATITWGPFTTTTDPAGIYIFTDLPCENHTITVGVSGYQAFIDTYAPPCNSTSIKDIALVRAPQSVPSLLFRELNPPFKDGSWGNLSDIPGFDHVGLFISDQNIVYESHPGYETGGYADLITQSTIPIAREDGVQAQHTLGSFSHDSPDATLRKVVRLEQVPIPHTLADAMRLAVEGRIGSPFQRVTHVEFLGLCPEDHKGGDGKFTCVGLVEWSAEEAGLNFGQGFVPNAMEALRLPSPAASPFEKCITVLSPSLLRWAALAAQPFFEAQEWLIGVLDPVDFILTDPLGRRFGYTQSHGHIDEIGEVYYTGNGSFEQFLLLDPQPGRYTLTLFGLGESVNVAIGCSSETATLSEFLPLDETTELTLTIAQRSSANDWHLYP